MVNIKKPDLSFGSLTPLNKSNITRIVEHHMAHPSWHIRDVHNYHKNSRGWSGIGYNYWIDFKGNIYEARGFNQGAHASGHNATSIGVGYQGDFTNQKMPEAQLQAGIELNKWLMQQLPNVNTIERIVGHRDVGNTACPGKNFKMEELKAGIAGAPQQTVKKAETKVKSIRVPNFTESIVDYMKYREMDASYENRERLAKEYGIKNYSGTGPQNLELLNKLKGGAATQKTKPKINLTADEKWGNDTTRGLQKYLGTPVDGILSGQPRNSVTASLYGTTVEYGSQGSMVIEALQIHLNSKGAHLVVDGKLGNATAEALQIYLGMMVVDGEFSRPSLVIGEMQRRLNAGTF